jgi:hypothetical protein
MNGVSAKPENEFRVGAVRAAVWTNPRHLANGKSFESHRIILERTYKDAQGEFKTTPALELNDVPKAILALKKIYEYCLTRKNGGANAFGNGAQSPMVPNRIP